VRFSFSGSGIRYSLSLLCKRHSSLPLQGRYRSVRSRQVLLDCSEPLLEFVWFEVLSLTAKDRQVMGLRRGQPGRTWVSHAPCRWVWGCRWWIWSVRVLSGAPGSEGLSGVSRMNVPGSCWSLCSREGAQVGVRLPKTPRMLGARQLLVVGRSGGRSVSEVCRAAALAAALSSSRPASL